MKTGFRIEDPGSGQRLTGRAFGTQTMKRLPVTIAIAALLAGGCASGTPQESDGVPRPPREQQAQKEYPGVVESVREVEVDSERTGVAPMVGAVIGGTVGSRTGSGRGSSVGAVVGTVVGGVAGEAVAQTGTQPGLEITVRLDEGRTIAVTQPAGETFRPGERVRVRSDGRAARVIH